MNKEELATKLAHEVDITKNEAFAAVESMLDLITDSLAHGDKVQFAGFGSFEVKDRAARVGRNPRTNEPVNIPERKMPVFKPGKLLKSAVVSNG